MAMMYFLIGLLATILLAISLRPFVRRTYALRLLLRKATMTMSVWTLIQYSVKRGRSLRSGTQRLLARRFIAPLVCAVSLSCIGPLTLGQSPSPVSISSLSCQISPDLSLTGGFTGLSAVRINASGPLIGPINTHLVTGMGVPNGWDTLGAVENGNTCGLWQHGTIGLGTVSTFDCANYNNDPASSWTTSLYFGTVPNNAIGTSQTVTFSVGSELCINGSLGLICSNVQSASYTVACGVGTQLSITTTSLLSGTVGSVYPPQPQSLAATGGTPPYTWSAVGLAPGLSIGPSSGLIGGTPTQAGTFPVTIAVTDSALATASAQFNLTVGSSTLSITTSSLPPGTVGSTYTQASSAPVSLMATGGTPPYTWSIVSGSGGLPDGLTLASASGTITGSPTTAGTSNFTVQVTDSAGSTKTQALSIQIGINSPPTNLKAIQVGTDGTQIAVTWNYGSDPVDGFIIQSSFPAIPFDTLTTVTTASVCGPSPDPAYTLFCTYSDLTVPPFLTKSYQISAYQGSTANPSAYSSPATAYQLKKCVLPWSGFPGTGRTDCHNANLVSSSYLNVDFTPDTALPSVNVAAQALPADPSRPRFDHFNWLQYIEHYPQCYLNSPLHTAVVSDPIFKQPAMGSAITAIGQVDPPINGYFEYWRDKNHLLADDLPFLFDEKPNWPLNQNIPLEPASFNNTYNISGPVAGDQNTVQTISFADQPANDCLTATTPDYVSFLTFLVGVSSPVGSAPPSYVVLNGFAWSSNYNLLTGGVTVFRAAPPPLTGGTGGIFNVADVDIDNLPPSIRQQLIRDGAQNVSTAHYVDRSAPMTSAFPSGPQGTNNWYTGPVIITLIATDIDGPSDIVATAYSVDAGSSTTYTGSFTVSGDGIHTIQFGSVDLAGNIEAPKSITVKIDTTPPVITASTNPSSLWPPNGKMVNVTVSGTITDATSGVNPSSAHFAIVDKYGSVQPSGNVTLAANGTYSFAISLQASRLGTDQNGRTYSITVTAQDNAGNQSSTATAVVVPHDQGH
jgi:hypothetical protein